MIEVIKAELTQDFINSKCIKGRIHSKFKSVINLELHMSKELNGICNKTTRLITVMTPEFSSIPDSLVISKHDFHKVSELSENTKVVKVKDKLLFDKYIICHIDNKTIVNSKLSIENNDIGEYRLIVFLSELKKYSSLSDKKDGFGYSYDEQYRKLSEFAIGLMNYNSEQVITAIIKNSGRGKGLTPSADDALVGIMAFIMGVSLSNLLPSPHKEYSDFMRSLIDQIDLSKYTTDVSKKYLYCAMEGRFSDTLLSLLKWVFNDSNKDIQKIINNIANIGSTSGMDMLAGVRIACETYLKSGLVTAGYLIN